LYKRRIMEEKGGRIFINREEERDWKRDIRKEM
jgi:hypothetical protein